MYKTITLKQANGSEKEYGFLATGATAIRYKQVFHEDLLMLLNKMDMSGDEPAPDADLTFADKLAFIMNAAAEKKDMKTLNFDAFVEWLDEIDSGELLEHMEEFVLMYAGSKAASASLKKRPAQRKGK